MSAEFQEGLRVAYVFDNSSEAAKISNNTLLFLLAGNRLTEAAKEEGPRNCELQNMAIIARADDG